MMTDAQVDGCAIGSKMETDLRLPPVLILGCGYTGSHVARVLAEEGHRVTATTRSPAKLGSLAGLGVKVVGLDWLEEGAGERLREIAIPGCLVLHSVPSLAGGRDASRLAALERRAARVVYLSTTSVYGSQRVVDAATAPAPRNERERARVATEQAVLSGPWSSLVLRPAAIYGPERGVHVSLVRGEFRLPEGPPSAISRIHVDDLARLAVAALTSSLEGAFPVADECPSPSEDVARFCVELMGVPMPETAPEREIPATRRNGRRVDGSTIRALLGVSLRYPSYREGIRAALTESGRAGA